MDEQPEAIAGVADADLAGQRAVVTGATSGIGRATALALGRLGADLVVHGRDERAGATLVDELERLGVDARFVAADFADVDAVRRLASEIRDATDGVDHLFNNAGGLFRGTDYTDLGVERTFHVNHLAPYLLTVELRDHLREGARVTTTASAAHGGASLQLDRVTPPDGLGGFGAYSHSKLANVLFAAELARRLPRVASNSVHPGAIPGSGFSRFLPGPLPELIARFDRLPGVSTVADGAAELLYAGVSERTAGVSGSYFADQRRSSPSQAAQDDRNARRLWRRSAELLGIEEPLAAAG
jgi:hypothetical protein